MINPYISLSWPIKHPYPTASSIKMKEKASFTTNANFTSFACTSLVMLIFIGLQAKVLQDLDEKQIHLPPCSRFDSPSQTIWRLMTWASWKEANLGFFHHAAEIELMSEEWSKFKQHPLISLGMGISNSLLKFTLKVKNDDFLFFWFRTPRTKAARRRTERPMARRTRKIGRNPLTKTSRCTCNWRHWKWVFDKTQIYQPS